MIAALHTDGLARSGPLQSAERRTLVSFTALRGNHPNLALTPAPGKEALVQILQIPYTDRESHAAEKRLPAPIWLQAVTLKPTAGRSDLGIRFWVAFLLGWGSPS